MPVSPASSASHSSPPNNSTPRRNSTLPKTPTSAVAQEALKKQDGTAEKQDGPAFNLKKKILGGAGALIGGIFKIDTGRDERILKAIFGEGAIETLLPKIEELAPELYAFLQRLFPTSTFLQANPKDTQLFLKGLTIHCLANLALGTLKKEEKDWALREKPLENKYTPEAFVQKLIPSLTQLIGTRLNEIDKKISQENPLKAEAFQRLGSDLLDLVLPRNDPFLNKVTKIKSREGIVHAIAEQLKDNYAPIRTWLEGGNLTIPKSQLGNLEAHLMDLGQFLIRSLGNDNYSKSVQFFKKLTGTDEIENLVKCFSPEIKEIIQKMIPPKFASFFTQNCQEATVADSCLLQIFASFGEKIFRAEIESGTALEAKEVMQKLSSRLMDLIKNSFEGLDRKKKQGNSIGIESLNPLALELLVMFTPESHFLTEFIKRHQTPLLKPISEKLFEVYKLRPNQQELKEYKERFLAMLGESHQETVDQLYTLCQNIASTGRNKLMKQLQNEEAVIKQFGELQKGGAESVKILAEGVNTIFLTDDHNIGWVGNELQSALALTLFKGIVHLFEIAPAEERDPKKVFSAIFHQLLRISNEHLPSVMKVAGETDEERFQKVSKSLVPFLNALEKIFYKDLSASASTNDLKILGKDFIKKEVGRFFANAIITLTDTLKEDQTTKKELKELYKSEYPLKFCHMLGQMGGEGASFVFRENGKEIAQNAIDAFAPWCLSPYESTEHLNALKDMFQGFIHELGHSRSPEIRKFVGFFSRFAESILLSLLKDASLSIKEEESKRSKAQPSLLEEGLLKIVCHLKNHFTAIVKTKQILKKTKADKISREDLIKVFEKEGVLHPAARNEAGENEFSEKWAKQLLVLFGLDEENVPLPLPSIVRTPLWKKVEKDLFPLLIKHFFHVINQPEAINNALLSLFNEIESSPQRPKVKEMLKVGDSYQKDLEKNLGELAKALIDLQPAFIAQAGLKNKKIREATGRAIGEPLRAALRPDGNPLSFIDVTTLVMEATVEKFLPCEWNEEKNKYEYLKVARGKEPIYVKTPNLARLFPRDEVEKISAKVILENERKRVEKEVPEKMGRIIRKETGRMIKEIFDALWANIKGKIQLIILKIFGRFATRAQKIIMPILALIIGLPLWIVLTLFRYLIWIPIRSMLRVYVMHQTRKRAGDVDLKIHDNLIFNIAEGLLPSRSHSRTNPS